MPKTQTSTGPFLAFDNNLTGHIYIIWPFQKLKLSSKKNSLCFPLIDLESGEKWIVLMWLAFY
jgi:hypothetical protein